MNYLTNYKNNSGFTLIEIVLTIGFLGLIFSLVILSFININNTLSRGKIYLQIISILNDELEKIKVFDYENIGLINGWPRGILPQEQVIEKNGLQIKVKYFIRNIDDPQDGTVSSVPLDRAPADYKLIELEGECLNCVLNVKSQRLTAIVAPKTVESATNNGSMFIQVIDASGKAVSSADVTVNYIVAPTFTIQDLTDNSGYLKLIDIPPGLNAYRIYINKNNYSSDRTYPPNDPQNPNPILSDQTVRANELTTVSFQIDKLSQVYFNFYNKLCQSAERIDFKLTGEKLIGRNPDVVKTDLATTSDQNGFKNFSLEWDNYQFKITDNRYIFQGSNFYLHPFFAVQPNSSYFLRITIASSSPINLLVSVLDSNKNYLDNAQVILRDNQNNEIIKITGEEDITETDWSNNNYSEISSNIDPETTPGDLQLKNDNGYPTSTEWLISKTIDFGTSTIIYKNFSWQGNVASGTSIKFQVAANNNNTEWDFIGPDGTSNSYFETQEFSLPGVLSNKRYFRYKVYLQSNDSDLTPVLNEVKIFYQSFCLSSGSALFSNLIPGSYNLQVVKTGYQIFNQVIHLSNSQPYNELEAILNP